MKKKVKENILNVLVDVKKELLVQYHNSNVFYWLLRLKSLSKGILRLWSN